MAYLLDIYEPQSCRNNLKFQSVWTNIALSINYYMKNIYETMLTKRKCCLIEAQNCRNNLKFQSVPISIKCRVIRPFYNIKLMNRWVSNYFHNLS